MKNVLKRAIALAMVVMMFAIPAMAASITSASYSNGNLNVEVAGYDVATDTDNPTQATVLVVKDGASLDTLEATDIVYIDQVDVVNGTYSFSMPIADRATALSASNVNLYIGGTNVAAAIPYVAEGDETASAISVAGTPTDPVITHTYTATLPATEYDTVEAAKAALVVKKQTLSDSVQTDEVTLESTDYTTDVSNVESAYTISVKVDGAEVATANFTLKTVTPPVGGKTAIAGTVMRNKSGSADPAVSAMVLITNGTTIVGSAVTDTEGKFEVEVAAGTYRVIVSYIRLTSSGYYNKYLPAIFDSVVVTDGAVSTVKTDGKDYVYCKDKLAADINGNGTVDYDDYLALAADYGKTSD